MSVLERSEADESAWLDWRRSGVTATDVADAAAGTYGGAYAVVARKRGLLEVEQTEQMARGHRWQPVVADAVHVLTGLWVVGEEAWCEHAEHPLRRATVDGFLAEAPEATLDDVVAVLEVKTRGTGTRPDRARWHDQVQWQMHVTGVPRAVIAEATIDDETDTCRGVRIHDVEADPDRQALLCSLAEDLWAHVQAGTLPDPDTPSALPAVKAVHGSADDSEAVDLADLADVVARYSEIKAAVKAVSDERDQLEALIREAVGPATKGTCDGFTVTVSRPALVLTDEAEAELLAAHPELGKVVLDRDRAKADQKDDYEAARRPLGARRLLVKGESQ